MLVAVPVNEGFIFFLSVVAVSVLGHFTIGNESTGIWVGNVITVSISCVAWCGFRLVRVILVRGVGDVTSLKSKVESGAGADTVIVEDIEICEETSGSLDDTNLEISE